MNSDALVAELVEASNGKDPREAAWAAGQDVVAIQRNGAVVRFLMWSEHPLKDGEFFSNRMPEEDWFFCLGKTPRVGLVHGQECLIYAEV